VEKFRKNHLVPPRGNNPSDAHVCIKTNVDLALIDQPHNGATQITERIRMPESRKNYTVISSKPPAFQMLHFPKYFCSHRDGIISHSAAGKPPGRVTRAHPEAGTNCKAEKTRKTEA